MKELIGRTIDHYRIIEKIGQGGSAWVYRAWDTKLDRFVAFKIIRKDAFPPETYQRLTKRFEREAKALAKLDHPNIVKVYDFGEYDGSAYLIMEMIDGGSLTRKIGHPIPFSEAVSYLAPIADGLEYAHRCGILHRDVKPSNIMFKKDGTPVLADFGIAKLLMADNEKGSSTLTGVGMGVGTPEYMAPEQGMSVKIDGRADEYALGIVLYEVLTAHKPFTAETPFAVLMKQHNEPLPDPRQFVPDLPDDAIHILYKALAKRAENRYLTMDEFAKALRKASKTNIPIHPRTEFIPNKDTESILETKDNLSVERNDSFSQEGTVPVTPDMTSSSISQNSSAIRQKGILFDQHISKESKAESKLPAKGKNKISPVEWIILGMALILAAVTIWPLIFQRPTSENSSSADTSNTQNRFSSISQGDIISFGRYEQDNKTENGPEPIYWRVLSVGNTSALLISQYGLDAKTYHLSEETVTWETSGVRQWLNEYFYDTAFNREEKGYVENTFILNSDNPTYNVQGGNNTQDKVFLLSINEVKRYFEKEADRESECTLYARMAGASENDMGKCWWWLRSPGADDQRAAYVNQNGHILQYGYDVFFNSGAVRPAIKISLNAAENPTFTSN